jgi:hypothetical protein
LFFGKITLGAFHVGGLWKKALTMVGMIRLTIHEFSSLANG